MKHYHIIALSLLLASCGNGGVDKNAEGKNAAADSLAAVKTEQTGESPEVDAVSGATNVANSPTFNGLIDVSPRDRATLTLTIGGTIHSLEVLPGEKVRKGQVVATVENPEFIELQMNYLEARAQMEFLEAEYHRQQALSLQNAVSQKALQQSRAEYNSMKARMMSARARLTTLGVDPDRLQVEGISPYLRVAAPISGYVANLDAYLGKFVDEDSPLCEIIDKSKPILVLTVYEQDLHLIGVGKKVAFKVNGMDNGIFRGVITSVGQVVNPSDYSIKVYVKVLESNPEFRPGMYIRARIEEETEEAD